MCRDKQVSVDCCRDLNKTEEKYSLRIQIFLKVCALEREKKERMRKKDQNKENKAITRRRKKINVGARKREKCL